MSEWTRREKEDERWKEDARRRDEGGERRIARRAGENETEEGTSEKENALSRSRGGEGEGEGGGVGGRGCRERVDKGQHAGRK